MDVLVTLCTVTRGGRAIGMGELDTVLIDGLPYGVFEWEGDQPSALMPLDPAHWHPWPEPPATHFYELPVEDPRSLS